MSEPWELEREAAEERYIEHLLEELGPDWATDNGFSLYEDSISSFTAERLQSYNLKNPNLAFPAYEALVYAESLMASYPKAALVFATTAIELAIKVVLLKPIVFGLVHTESMAVFITELTTQHTGMDRFQSLLTEILNHFGGVDLKTFSRTGSTQTLWQEIGEVQKARNAIVHRGESADDDTALLAINVAVSLLKQIFPLVLDKLRLHLHDPLTVCGAYHSPSIFDDISDFFSST